MIVRRYGIIHDLSVDAIGERGRHGNVVGLIQRIENGVSTTVHRYGRNGYGVRRSVISSKNVGLRHAEGGGRNRENRRNDAKRIIVVVTSDAYGVFAHGFYFGNARFGRGINELQSGKVTVIDALDRARIHEGKRTVDVRCGRFAAHRCGRRKGRRFRLYDVLNNGKIDERISRKVGRTHACDDRTVIVSAVRYVR